MTQRSCDVIIIGAGPAGLCFARSLADRGIASVLVERQPRAALADPSPDGRDIALTHRSVELLQALGVWAHLPTDELSHIAEARVVDGGTSRPMTLSSASVDRLASIVSNRLIRKAAFAQAMAHPNVTLLDGATIADTRFGEGEASVTLADGTELVAPLLVAADSRFSDTRKKAGIPTQMRDFGKTMVVCQMAHERPHGNVAHECFLYQHTLAVLPLAGNRSSVILTLPPARAEEVMQMEAAALSAWVTQEFGARFGAMTLDAPRYAYPLVGTYASRFAGRRLALIGDAAVGMHPVTAHGFNFGLRGQDVLSGLIAEACEYGGDLGDPALLARYQRAHRRATLPLYLTTNGIVSLYTRDTDAAHALRRTLLRVADHMLPVKGFMVHKLTERSEAVSPLSAALGIFSEAAAQKDCQKKSVVA